MALKRMDNVGIVVEDLGRAIEFFGELGGQPSKENGPDGSPDWATSAWRLQ